MDLGRIVYGSGLIRSIVLYGKEVLSNASSNLTPSCLLISHQEDKSNEYKTMIKGIIRFKAVY